MSVVNRYGEIINTKGQRDKNRSGTSWPNVSSGPNRPVMSRPWPPLSCNGDTVFGKLLTILSILSVPVILFLYYTQVPYTKGAGEHWEYYVTFGSLLAIVFDVIGFGLLYFTLQGVYTVMGGHMFFDSLLDLQDNRVTIGFVRFVLLPAIMLLACISNYFIATQIFFDVFNQLAWIVGPFLPLLMLAVIVFALMLD